MPHLEPEVHWVAIVEAVRHCSAMAERFAGQQQGERYWREFRRLLAEHELTDLSPATIRSLLRHGTPC
jgi:hypothetical protein